MTIHLPEPWDLASASNEAKMEEYLNEGWEPFAVVHPLRPSLTHGVGPIVYFRRPRPAFAVKEEA